MIKTWRTLILLVDNNMSWVAQSRCLHSIPWYPLVLDSGPVSRGSMPMPERSLLRGDLVAWGGLAGECVDRSKQISSKCSRQAGTKKTPQLSLRRCK
jgi:hypothetical protein